MYVGFSAFKTSWVECHRVLAWSLSDTGVARDIYTMGLPVFDHDWSSSFKLFTVVIVGILLVVLFLLV